MILEYRCENYRSIGREVTFSMLATVDDSHEENYVFDRRISHSILKSAVIYGGNGSGKSNFILSLNYLKNLVLDSNKLQPGDPLPFFPHKLLEKQNSKFTIHFTKGESRFLYYVELNTKAIEKEYLYFYPNNRVSKIFERDGGDISFSKQFASRLSSVMNAKVKTNRLFLSCAANDSNVKEIDDVFKFFNNDVVIKTNEAVPSANNVELNDEMASSVLDFMHRTGEKDLIGISVKTGEGKIGGQASSSISDVGFQNTSKSRLSLTSDIKLDYGAFSLDYSQSSDGIQKIFELLPSFIDAINGDKVFVIDELEAHLHPLMVSELLRIFSEAKESKAQLVFTTHDTNILSLDRFRRDQIWFTDMCENHMSELFSLAEVKAVRKDENVSKNYLLGKYKGIPMIDPEKKIRLLEK